VPVTVTGDTYFIVEAGAKLSPFPSPPAVADMIVPGLVPLGFTNPVFVDLGGDGFDPPGLPVMASLSGTGEALPAFARVVRRDETLLAQVSGWAKRLVDRFGASGSAGADDDREVLTGTAHKAEVERQKTVPSAEYFPLYTFRIPERAVEEAIDRLPEPERSQVRAGRR
jgi:hypothetical protein